MSDKLKATIKFASSMILLIIAYLPTLQWMIDRWMLKESYYGHGFLIPIASGFAYFENHHVPLN